MKNIKLIIIISAFLFISIILFSFVILKPKISAFLTLSPEKCVDADDDCWHALAHQTLNRTYCLKIIDDEPKEHCLEHIPEINKENK